MNEYHHSVCTLMSLLNNGVMSILFLPTFILLTFFFNQTRPSALASDIIGLLYFSMCISLHLPGGFDQIIHFSLLPHSLNPFCIFLPRQEKIAQMRRELMMKTKEHSKKLHQMNDLCTEKKKLDSQLNILQNQQVCSFSSDLLSELGMFYKGNIKCWLLNKP